MSPKEYLEKTIDELRNFIKIINCYDSCEILIPLRPIIVYCYVIIDSLASITCIEANGGNRKCFIEFCKKYINIPNINADEHMMLVQV